MYTKREGSLAVTPLGVNLHLFLQCWRTCYFVSLAWRYAAETYLCNMKFVIKNTSIIIILISHFQYIFQIPHLKLTRLSSDFIFSSQKANHDLNGYTCS